MGMKNKFKNIIVGCLSVLLGIVAMTGVSLAETESSIACVEGAEPTPLAYGDHTTGCSISPAVDTDTFTFTGVINDHVRINVKSTTTSMDPLLEVRDSGGNLIASQSCSGFGCTFSLDMILPASGTYLLTMSDVGNNEAGSYILQLEKILPALLLQRLDYDMEVSDSISPATDIDHYYFNGTAGTSIRLNARSTSTAMDPTIELRAPNGTPVIIGPLDGASCSGFGCTFSVDLVPAFTGTYSLILYDNVTNEAGNYQLSLWCIGGPCDSDGDGLPDAPHPVLSYDAPVSDSITPAVDGDFFTFNGTAGTSIRLNARSTSTAMDPTIELRDPNGTLVLNGAVDGASCSGFGCTFSVELVPAFTGTYSLILYDAATNEAGDYQLSLWCIVGPCDSDGNGTPDADPPVLSYIMPVSDSITPAVDGDFYTFNATAGTSIRLNARSTSTAMDPTIELRDPNGTLVLNGAVDGASCSGFGCTFSVELVPAFTGTYSLILYDAATNEAGNYQLSLWCILGDCDSDADGFIDYDREIINYGDSVIDNDVSPAVDGDFYLFKGTVDDQIRLTARSTSTAMDPTIEVYDPNGTLVLNGAVDGASCSGFGCVFSVDIVPAITGVYSVVFYDLGTNEAGRYQFGLQCVFSPGDFICDDITSPLPVCDNCSVVGNPGQRETDGDGYGNFCDPDLDNNGVVQAADLAIFKPLFFTTDPDADFDGNGIVQAGDLAIMKKMFFQPPGPSCETPNTP